MKNRSRSPWLPAINPAVLGAVLTIVAALVACQKDGSEVEASRASESDCKERVFPYSQHTCPPTPAAPSVAQSRAERGSGLSPQNDLSKANASVGPSMTAQSTAPVAPVGPGIDPVVPELPPKDAAAEPSPGAAWVADPARSDPGPAEQSIAQAERLEQDRAGVRNQTVPETKSNTPDPPRATTQARSPAPSRTGEPNPVSPKRSARTNVAHATSARPEPSPQPRQAAKQPTGRSASAHTRRARSSNHQLVTRPRLRSNSKVARRPATLRAQPARSGRPSVHIKERQPRTGPGGLVGLISELIDQENTRKR